MAELPLEPRLAASLLAAGRFGCGQEIATICAMLSVHSVWAGGGGQRKALEEAQSRCGHLSTLQALPSHAKFWACACAANRASNSGFSGQL